MRQHISGISDNCAQMHWNHNDFIWIQHELELCLISSFIFIGRNDFFGGQQLLYMTRRALCAVPVSGRLNTNDN